MEGLPALDVWDLVINTFSPKEAEEIKHPESTRPKILPDPYNLVQHLDNVTPSLNITRKAADLIILEDNEAVIKMVNKGRSPQMRHIARTHRVNLDALFETITKDPAISLKYVNTKEQLADIFTKGSFTAASWRNLLELNQIGKQLPDLQKPTTPS